MDLPLPWLVASIAARTAIVIFALFAGIRITGKRGMGGLNLFDLVLVLLLGNAVQNALTMGKGNLGVGLASAGTLLAIDLAMGSLFAKQPRIEKWFEGEPVIIFQGGRFERGAMKRAGVTEEEVQAAMRDMGITDMKDVRLAVLEDDGSISIIPKEPPA